MAADAQDPRVAPEVRPLSGRVCRPRSRWQRREQPRRVAPRPVAEQPEEARGMGRAGDLPRSRSSRRRARSPAVVVFSTPAARAAVSNSGRRIVVPRSPSRPAYSLTAATPPRRARTRLAAVLSPSPSISATRSSRASVVPAGRYWRLPVPPTLSASARVKVVSARQAPVATRA